MNKESLDGANVPVISVVMSVYNDEKYLRASIESILDQTFRNFEFIIVNDGSIDGSLSIINYYAQKDNRIVVINQKNFGLAKSLNRAIELAKGKYIARQDADDISLPERLEKQFVFFNENDDYFLASTNYKIIDAQSEIIGNPAVPFVSESNDLRRSITYFNPFAHPAVMFKNDFSKIGYFYDPYFRFAQDYDLFMRIVKNYKTANIYDILLLKRETGSNISSAKKRQQRYYAVRAKLKGVRLVRNPLKYTYYLMKDVFVILTAL